MSLSSFGVPERFVLAPGGQVLSVLPEDTADDAVALVYGTELSGVAGAGSVALGNEHLLGGWMSYACRLISPRRFAVRAGALLLEGKTAEGILGGVMRSKLGSVLAQAGSEPSAALLEPVLKEAAQAALMELGWQLDSCRLAKIHLTRRDQP